MEVASEYAVKSIDELESIHHGAVKLAGAELGVRSFELQVLDFPARWPDYPEHDHAADGQEEVYVLLRGSAEFRIDGESAEVTAGQVVRIDAAARRKLIPGPEGVRILAIGCSGDRPYGPEGFGSRCGHDVLEHTQRWRAERGTMRRHRQRRLWFLGRSRG